MLPAIPPSWNDALGAESQKDYYAALDAFLEGERDVLPPREDIFRALEYTAPKDVTVVLLGQDPYPTPGDAHGLSFSVRPGRKIPASLRRIFRELSDDLGCRIPNNGFLEPWAHQGVLLLNTILTVRAGTARSHAGKGWERFTNRVIEVVNSGGEGTVFLLLGKDAQTKRNMIDETRHAIVAAGHPSPLNQSGFLGCGCFSKVNGALRSYGRQPVDWQLPDVTEP